jgi:hypothetical protein
MVAGTPPPIARAGSSVPIHGISLCLAAAQAADKPQVESLTPTAFGNARGTFVVYRSVLAATAPEAIAASRGDAPGLPKRPRLDRRSQPFVAFWHDIETGGLFVYGKLLRGPHDVEEALVALERGFAPMLLAGVVEGRAAGAWHEATVEGLHSLMELPGEPPAEGPIGTTYAECPPFGCNEHRGGGFVPPGAQRWSALPAPALDADLEDVIIGVVQAINCCGGGGGDPDPPGGGCPGCCCCCLLERTTKLAEHDGQVVAAAACCSGSSCDDGNECTLFDRCANPDVEYCDCGDCCGVPKDCDDGNPCTMNACHPSTGDCITTPLHGASCPDEGNPCTQNICQYASCIHPPLCPAGNSCCQEGGLTTCCAVCCYNPLHCCNAGTTCCGGSCCGERWRFVYG